MSMLQQQHQQQQQFQLTMEQQQREQQWREAGDTRLAGSRRCVEVEGYTCVDEIKS